jgi:hypothetical protein
MDEKMKFLWPNSLHLNTVHVNDVAKAICKYINIPLFIILRGRELTF